MATSLEEAEARFAAIHARDPKIIQGSPHALRYHERLAHWIERVHPEPSEEMKIAARCQHLRRWAIPRSDHAEGRAGYRRWRAVLAQRTADEVATILAEAGYDERSIARVQAFLLKTGREHDEEVQSFEDAICLVFLESELESFAARYDRDKVANILTKTWNKMSPTGHRLARELASELPEPLRDLLARL